MPTYSGRLVKLFLPIKKLCSLFNYRCLVAECHLRYTVSVYQIFFVGSLLDNSIGHEDIRECWCWNLELKANCWRNSVRHATSVEGNIDCHFLSQMLSGSLSFSSSLHFAIVDEAQTKLDRPYVRNQPSNSQLASKANKKHKWSEWLGWKIVHQFRMRRARVSPRFEEFGSICSQNGRFSPQD